jgi:hypothetical protein
MAWGNMSRYECILSVDIGIDGTEGDILVRRMEDGL